MPICCCLKRKPTLPTVVVLCQTGNTVLIEIRAFNIQVQYVAQFATFTNICETSTSAKFPKNW